MKPLGLECDRSQQEGGQVAAVGFFGGGAFGPRLGGTRRFWLGPGVDLFALRLRRLAHRGLLTGLFLLG